MQVLFVVDMQPYTDYINSILDYHDALCTSLEELLAIPKTEVGAITVVGENTNLITELGTLFVKKGYNVIIDLDGCPKMSDNEKKKWIKELLLNNIMVLE